jgi:ATP-dependent DNA helicase RecQ
MTQIVDIDEALLTHFGYSEFRPGQRAVIESLLAGKSAAAVFPTGSGKSLCYQLPALLLEGVTLVVSPLIALMKDQIDALAARGIAACRLDSTLTADEYRDVMQRVRAGDLRMLYVAPERFQNERFREALQRMRVALFAVDEAHCISEWGHNFRPDYLKLVEFARQCHAERVLALTATATPAVLEDVCRAFQIEPASAIRTGFYRPNLTVLTTPVEERDRDALLLERLKSRPRGATIAYVTLQKTAEQVAERLAAAGLEAKAYHAGLETEDRTRVQNWFIRSEAGIVVATIAFGMGVDKANIRYVYHYNLPKSLENFSQEIGRAGRDGAPAICETLVCVDDLSALENFAYGDTPTLAAVQGLVRELFDQDEHFDVSYHELSGRHDIRPLVVRTLMTYLELEGYLAGGTPFYSSYKFKPLKTSQQILGAFEGERREFLKQLFLQTKKARLWVSIDVDVAAKAMREPRERLIRALDYLSEQGSIELATQGTRNQYQRLKMPTDQAALADDLHARTVRREEKEIVRLHEVIELVERDGCQVAALGRHFGDEQVTACGHCTWCTNGHQPVKLRRRQSAAIDEQIIARAKTLRQQKREIFKDIATLARFLCGVSSPAFTRDKLTGDKLFGALAEVPFQDVVAALR